MKNKYGTLVSAISIFLHSEKNDIELGTSASYHVVSHNICLREAFIMHILLFVAIYFHVFENYEILVLQSLISVLFQVLYNCMYALSKDVCKNFKKIERKNSKKKRSLEFLKKNIVKFENVI